MQHKSEQSDYKPVNISIENGKEDSPVSVIIYNQVVSGSKGSEQSYLISIVVGLKNDHPECDAVKKILLKEYIHIVSMQPDEEFEHYEINAKDLKDVVKLLGPTYLSASVAEEVSNIKFLADFRTKRIRHGAGFYSGNKLKLNDENEGIETYEQNFAGSCRIS